MTLQANSSTSLLENHFYAIEMPKRERSVSDVPYGGTPSKLGKLTNPSNLDLLGLRGPSSTMLTTSTFTPASSSLSLSSLRH